MKVYKYQVNVYGSVLDSTHGMSQTQTRLYFEGKGVLGYRDKNKIDFFSTDSEMIEEAEEIIRNKKDGEYWGVVNDVPEKLIKSVILAGIKSEKAQKEIQTKGKSLVSLIKD